MPAGIDIRRVTAAAAAVVMAAGLMLVAVAGPVGATTVSVANETEYTTALTNLSADGSGPHTIEITADITITSSTTPKYDGDQPLTINGNGHTLSGGGNSAVIDHDTSAVLTLNGLTVTGSTDSAILANGEVKINGSTFTGNNNGGNGGAIRTGSATVTDSTFTGNDALDGDGGAIWAVDGLTITGSTFSGNSATGDGGAVFHGIEGPNPTVAITNSTFTGNTANGAGGGVAVNGGNEQIPLTLVYVTIVDNSATRGANIATAATTTVTSFGTVVTGPLGGGNNCEILGTTVSQGYNYADDASCGFTGTGDTENGADPQLDALGSFGGPTQTRPPAVSSPLVDAIPLADCDATVTVDQRGLPRPADGNNDGTDGCDIGAVELQPTAPPPLEPSFTG